MSVNMQVKTAPVNLMLALSLSGIALVLGVGIILGGKLALYALFGLLFFILFAHYPVIGFYATTALLLLSGSSGIIGFVGGGGLAVTFARLCGTAALAAWGVNVLTRKIRFEMNWPALLISIFCAWALVGTLSSRDPSQTWPEWVRLITLLGYFWLGVNTLNNARNLHIFILVIVLCGLVMSLAAVAQYFMPQYQLAGAEAWGNLGATDGAFIDQESLQGEAAIRVSGRAGHSNWLAMIILLILPLNLYWYSVAKSPNIRLLAIATCVIEGMALVLTFTRTGLVIGVILAFLLLSKRYVRLTPQRLFGGLLALVVIWVLLPGPYKERVLSPKQYTGSKSVESRMTLQTAAGRYAMQNPIFGLGMGGFGLNFIHENNETAQTMKFMVYEQNWMPIFIGTHNMYLEIACHTGFIGLALFMVFYFLMLRGVHRREEAYRAAGDEQGAALAGSLVISLIGFLLCAIFLHALTQKIWWMIAVAGCVLPLYNVSFLPEKAPSGSLPKS